MAENKTNKDFRRMQELAGLSTEHKSTLVTEATLTRAEPQAKPQKVPADVASLSKAQTAATTVQSKAKNINSIQEFPGAFENWFKSLGFQPGKISKSAIRSEVEKVLVKLGYK